ncbi:M61 family metallopeptidase [Flavihumibacter sp. R14]|nr:M61 family metallopeptidase [Flavihumibacter soli]
MIRLKFVAATLLLFSTRLAFSQELKYEISFPNAVHHEAEVSLDITQIPAGPLTIRMSRSSPGRYATHEFGKNIYNVKAFNASGQELQISQVKGDVYQVEKHNGNARITYTVFGNWVDGTYLGIDKTHAHMNMPATFMWVKGMENRPVSIKFNDLDKYGWKVATQLQHKGGNTYTAANHQYMMDSPTELSAFKVHSWEDINTDKTKQTISVSMHSPDAQPVVDNFGKMVKRMVDESKMVFGELPKFDHGVYTFLQDVNPENSGDGMEHRNSTVIVERSQKVEGNEEDLLSTFSHEFFHAWNVERIRPKSLEPFNFEHSNTSSELWFAEGFTQYYGSLILKRAGFRDLNSYCNTIAGLANGVLNMPGANTYPATQMSRYAVFADAGVAVDQTNQINIFTSYYYYGATIALALDLRLRSEFKLSLDDYMKAVWKTHGKPEIPYTVPDLQNVLAKLTNKSFANDFFGRYVNGIDKNDYVKLLSNAGLVLRRAAPEKASLGMIRLSPANGKLRLSMNTLKGSAAYLAGMDNGDYFLKINDDELKTPADLNTLLAKYKPGEEVNLTYEHRGEVNTVKVKLQESNSFEVVPVEKTGKTLTPEAEKFRTAWLDSQIK